MKSNREMLEDQLESYEKSLGGLSSYITELKTMTATHGTDVQVFEDDLMEAEHNVTFYEDEIVRIKKLIGGSASGPTQPGLGTILPQTSKEGISALIFSTIGFIAGALLGPRLHSRKGSEDSH